MSSYQKNPIRLISAVVIGCFLLQDAAWAAPTTLAPSPITAAATAQAAISQFALNPSQLQIPLQAVTLQEVHVGTNGRLIIHIQDAHANLSGQQSLAKALDHFMSQYDLKVVLVEGSARDSSLDEIRKLAPIKEWQIIARRFLYDGIISGEEYLNLTTEHPMKILGIEYRDLYDESIRAYASLVDRRNDILHYLYKSKVSLDRLKAKFYTREIRDYEAKKGADDSGLTDFKTGFSNLLELADKAGYPLTELPNTQKLKSLLGKEKTIRFDQANAEQQKILESLSASGAASDVQEFIEASKRLKTSQVSQYLLIKNLFKTAEDKKLALDTMPELKAYERYLSEFLDLKLDSLLAELDLLEDRVYEQLLPSEDARKVRAIDRFLGLLGNAYKLQMSSRDFGMFTFNEKDFPTESWLAFMNQKLAELGFFESMIPYQKYLEDARKDFGKFYELVGQRDQAFVENAARLMKEQNTDAAILIAGGYHTAHLTELLRQEGTSYVVLTPVVTDTTDHERYEELLLQHLKQQEKKLSGNKDTGAYRAQNVAATKIPRGIRPLGARTAIAEDGLSQAGARFADSRMGEGFSERIVATAKRSLVPENQHPKRSDGARLAKSQENKAQHVLNRRLFLKWTSAALTSAASGSPKSLLNTGQIMETSEAPVLSEGTIKNLFSYFDFNYETLEATIEQSAPSEANKFHENVQRFLDSINKTFDDAQTSHELKWDVKEWSSQYEQWQDLLRSLFDDQDSDFIDIIKNIHPYLMEESMSDFSDEIAYEEIALAQNMTHTINMAASSGIRSRILNHVMAKLLAGDADMLDDLRSIMRLESVQILRRTNNIRNQIQKLKDMNAPSEVVESIARNNDKSIQLLMKMRHELLEALRHDKLHGVAAELLPYVRDQIQRNGYWEDKQKALRSIVDLSDKMSEVLKAKYDETEEYEEPDKNKIEKEKIDHDEREGVLSSFELAEQRWADDGGRNTAAARLAQTAALQDNPYRSPESEIRKYGFGSATKLLVAYFKHPLLSALLTQLFSIAVIYVPSELLTVGSESGVAALASLGRHAFLLIYSSLTSVLGAPLFISSSRTRIEEAVYDQLERWVEDGGRKPDLTAAETKVLREGRVILSELESRFETRFWRHLISVLKGLLDRDRNAVMIRAVEFLKAHENGVETTADLGASEGMYEIAQRAQYPAVGARLAVENLSKGTPLSADDLLDRIYAVHATVQLPSDGRVIAGQMFFDGGGRKRPMTEEDGPSFRMGTHWSLGEMVRSADWNTEEVSYAVVAPLRSLINQAANLFPTDTFIVGDYRLDKSSVVFVPRGTNVSRLPAEVRQRIKEYDPNFEYAGEKGLRAAIKRHILDQGGWDMRLAYSFDRSAPAIRDGADINDPKFFGPLWERFPWVGYGTHLESPRGQGFRLGAVEHLTYHLITQNYLLRSGLFGRSTSEVKFYRELIRHHLEALDRWIQDSGLPTASRETYKNKKAEILEWLDLMDADLYLRERYGRTLLKAPPKTVDFIKKNKGTLLSPRNRFLWFWTRFGLEKVPPAEPVSGDMEVPWLQSLDPSELGEFLKKVEAHAEIRIEAPEFRTAYCIMRWLLIGSQQARVEGLDRMLLEQVRRLQNPKQAVLSALNRDLNQQSNRLSTALEIIREPGIRAALVESGMTFKNEGPNSLPELIQADPELAPLFADPRSNVRNDDKFVEFLKNIDHKFAAERITREFDSYEEAKRRVKSNRLQADRRKKSFDQALTRPMIESKRGARPGDPLNLYQYFYRDYGRPSSDQSLVLLWRSVGVPESVFRKTFPADNDFWSSGQTLAGIYQELMAAADAESADSTNQGLAAARLASRLGDKPSGRSGPKTSVLMQKFPFERRRELESEFAKWDGLIEEWLKKGEYLRRRLESGKAVDVSETASFLGPVEKFLTEYSKKIGEAGAELDKLKASNFPEADRKDKEFDPEKDLSPLRAETYQELADAYKLWEALSDKFTTLTDLNNDINNIGARLAKRKNQEILALDERISNLEDRIRTRFTMVEPRIGPAVIDLFERTVRVKFATALGAVRAEYCRTIDVSSIRTRNLISHITLMNSDGPDNLQSYFGRGTVNSTQMQAFIVTLEDLTHWSSQYEDPEFWSWVGQFTALTEQRQSLNGAFEPINRPLPLATEVPGGLFYDLASGPYFRNFLQSLSAKQKYFAIDMDPFVVAYLNEWARIYGVEDRFSAVRSDVMRWKKPAEPVGVVRIKNVWNYVDGFGSKLDEVLGTGVTPTEPWIMPGGALLLQTDSESDHHQLLSSINSVNRQAQILIGSGWSFEGYLDDPGLVYALDQMIFRRPQAGEEKKAIRSAGIMISRWESFRLKVLEESDVRRRERMRVFGGDLFGSLLSGFLSGNFSVIDSLDVDFIEDDEDDDSITNGARLAGRLDSRNPFAYSDALEKAAGPGARLALTQDDSEGEGARLADDRTTAQQRLNADINAKLDHAEEFVAQNVIPEINTLNRRLLMNRSSWGTRTQEYLRAMSNLIYNQQGARILPRHIRAIRPGAVNYQKSGANKDVFLMTMGIDYTSAGTPTTLNLDVALALKQPKSEGDEIVGDISSEEARRYVEVNRKTGYTGVVCPALLSVYRDARTGAPIGLVEELVIGRTVAEAYQLTGIYPDEEGIRLIGDVAQAWTRASQLITDPAGQAEGASGLRGNLWIGDIHANNIMIRDESIPRENFRGRLVTVDYGRRQTYPAHFVHDLIRYYIDQRNDHGAVGIAMLQDDTIPADHREAVRREAIRSLIRGIGRGMLNRGEEIRFWSSVLTDRRRETLLATQDREEITRYLNETGLNVRGIRENEQKKAHPDDQISGARLAEKGPLSMPDVPRDRYEVMLPGPEDRERTPLVFEVHAGNITVAYGDIQFVLDGQDIAAQTLRGIRLGRFTTSEQFKPGQGGLVNFDVSDNGKVSRYHAMIRFVPLDEKRGLWEADYVPNPAAKNTSRYKNKKIGGRVELFKFTIPASGARLAMDRREFLGRMRDVMAALNSMDRVVELGAQAALTPAAGDAVAADPFADIGEYFVQSGLRRMKVGVESRPDDGAVQEVFAQSPQIKEIVAPAMAERFGKWSRSYAENAKTEIEQLTARYTELTRGNSESAAEFFGKQLQESLDLDIQAAGFEGDVLNFASKAARRVLDPEGKTRPIRRKGGAMDRNAQRLKYLGNIKARLMEFETAGVEAQKRTFAVATARLMETARRQVEETIASIPQMQSEWRSLLGGDAATATPSALPPHELLGAPAELPRIRVERADATADEALKALSKDRSRWGESVPIAVSPREYVEGRVSEGAADGALLPAPAKSLIEKVEEEIDNIGNSVESALSKRFSAPPVSLGFVFNVKNMAEDLEKNAAMIRAVARWPVPAGKSGRKVFILNPGGETRLPEDLAALALVFESWEEFNKIMSDNPDLIFAGIMDVESIRDQQSAVKDQAAQLRLVQVSLTGMNKKTPLVPVAQAGALARIAGQVKSLGMKNEDAVNAFAEIAVDTGLVTAGQTDGLAGFLLTQAESGLSAQEYFTGLEDRALRALESLDKMLGRLVQAARMAAISA